METWEVKSIASGSTGNAYTVSDGQQTALIEAGIPIKKIQEAVDYRLTQLAGCLVTHEHGDHIKAAKDLAKNAVNVYATAGTFTAKGLAGHRFKTIKAQQQFKLGNWDVMPFDVQHDSAEPVGFYIYSPRLKKYLLYATDTYYVRYRFNFVHTLMIECNYDDETIAKHVAGGSTHRAQAKRVYQSHMSLETLQRMLGTMNTKQLEEIWLLHLSDKNSNEKLMRETIQRQTGAIVRIA